MKTSIAFWIAGLGLALAVRGEDLTTLTGQTYADIKVQRYDWEGIYIQHAGGISKIYYREIPAELREHYKNMAPAPDSAENAAPAPPADVGPDDLVTRSGTVYRHAAVRRVDTNDVTIKHDGGLAKVPFVDIPEDLQEKFRTPPKPAMETPLGSNDLATTDGQIYRNVQVKKIEADGLTLQHDAGLAKLEFPLLPEAWQTKYEYDPRAAEVHRRSVVAGREQAAREQQAIRAQNAAERAEQIKNEPIRVFEVSASKTGAHEYRVRFSVRNNDDKPRAITAGGYPFTIPANSTLSGLEVKYKFSKPTTFTVSSGFYSTSHVLDW